MHALVPPSYFVEPRQLFPLWPAWNLAWAIGLFGATAVLLFVPKLLALALVLLRNPKEYGGAARLLSACSWKSCSLRCLRRCACCFTPSSC